jgi:5-methyltetrahydrofolate--homocysteine methyltransferase
MNLQESIASGPVLTDGAWGTELQKAGLAPGECPDYWSILHPDRVRDVAQSYVDAGSRVILTWTFQANRVALAEHGLEARAAEINAAGVRISREAAAGNALVFASMGPTGKLLSAEEIEESAVSAAYAEQAQALADAGADALIFETMSDLAEASAGLAAARKTGLPVIVSFTFESGKNRDRTMTGVTPEQAANRMAEEGAAAIGANCGVGIAEYVPICRRLRAATTLPVWIKANAGLPEMIEGRTEYRTGPEQFARHIPALVREGANFVGGCCGTSPEFIRAAAGVLAAACA